jgi:hypothetical protein
MKIGNGALFWPRPILHPDKQLKEDGRNIIITKLCGYYNQWCYCVDIVITSCKHTFHPFCLVAMLENSNKYYVCEQKSHPDWWHSWGFRPLDEDLQ